MFQRALTWVINPDLLLGSRLVLLCKGSSHVVSPVSLEGPAERSEPHRKHRWQRDGGNLRKHRKASHQELFRGRETPRNNWTIEIMVCNYLTRENLPAFFPPFWKLWLFQRIERWNFVLCCKSTFILGQRRPQSSVSQQQIDFKQEKDCDQGQTQEWGSEANGNSGVESAVVACTNIQRRSWENYQQEKHSSTV